jgi:hypothetical protein
MARDGSAAGEVLRTGANLHVRGDLMARRYLSTLAARNPDLTQSVAR